MGDQDRAGTLSPGASPGWLRRHPVLQRGRILVATVQRGDKDQRRAAISEADSLVVHARQAADPFVVAEALRVASIVHLVAAEGDTAADRVLDTLADLLTHARGNGLLVVEADTHALLANAAFRADPESHAILDELAQALAVLDQTPPFDERLDAGDWADHVARALSDTAIVLHHLDVHDLAADLFARGQQLLEAADEPHGMIVLLFNRVRSMLLRGLQLERTGQPDEARHQFAAAARVVAEVQTYWPSHIFPDAPGRRATEQVVVFAVASALHRPAAHHVPRLEALRQTSVFPDDPALLDIATARCLRESGRLQAAIQLLEEHPIELDPVDKAEPAVRLSLIRELTRLQAHGDTGSSNAGAWSRYAHSLEGSLLSLQRARLSALLARVEHVKLQRRHQTVAREAVHDSLTGLPNRRFLERHLDEVATSEHAEPPAIAMIDLDGFKGVNDLHSHAVGDAVLATIASTLRRSLRSTDVVARYGGDEFVAVLPGTGQDEAAAVLQRAVSAIADLPASATYGVTVSVGVTTVRTGETIRAALARADDAMYTAKRLGTNRVTAAPDAA